MVCYNLLLKIYISVNRPYWLILMKPSYCEQWHGTHWQNKQLDLCHFLPVFFLVFWLCRNPGCQVHSFTKFLDSTKFWKTKFYEKKDFFLAATITRWTISLLQDLTFSILKSKLGSYVLESQARFATELCIHTQSWQIGEEGGDRMATNHLCPGYNIWWIRTCYSLWQPDTLISWL
jgi:hypothetical protein